MEIYKEDIVFINQRIKQFFKTIELPATEIGYLHTRKNVQLWMLKRLMTKFEKTVYKESEDPATVIHPILQAGQLQIKDAYCAIINERYGVQVDNVFFFDLRVDALRHEFYHPIITICAEPINKSPKLPLKNEFEENMSRSVAKRLRELLGRGPQDVKVYDFDGYILYWFTGILTEALRLDIDNLPDNPSMLSLFSISLKYAVFQSLEVMGRKTEEKFYLEDYQKNEVVMLVENKVC